MYGAILGDIIGSPYEFDRGVKTKDFPLFIKESEFTDDSVMTAAVAEALLNAREQGVEDDSEAVKALLIASMRSWGKKYPGAGYGARFGLWLADETAGPYQSYGNGAAMRASAAGWLYNDMFTVRRMAALTAEVTHNHPEGIKGAEAVAAAIFMARTGSTKDEIKAYIEKEFGYDLSRTCDEIRPDYRHNESCQKTVPEAITAFLEGTDFEDVIRTAVSLGGDCDTLTCIAGSIAEAFCGVPFVLISECKKRLPEDIINVIDRFDKAVGRYREDDDGTMGNAELVRAIERASGSGKKEDFIKVLDCVVKLAAGDGVFLLPVETPPELLDMIGDPEKLKAGDELRINEEIRMKILTLTDADGREWYAAFTDDAQMKKGAPASVIAMPVRDILETALSSETRAGLAVNPWENTLFLDKELLNIILDGAKPKTGIFYDVGDITALDVECIVNATDEEISGSGGVSRAIFNAAGPKLKAECGKIGGCKTGKAKITEGFDLKAKYVIHTVGPYYKKDGEWGDLHCRRQLAACYTNCLDLAKEHGIRSIAFPAISTGTYKFPPYDAAATALGAISKWLSENPDYAVTVVMSCRDEKTYQAYTRAGWATRMKYESMTVEEYDSVDPKELSAFSLAEGGAMGVPNQVILARKKDEYLEFIYTWGDRDKLGAMFPWLDKFQWFPGEEKNCGRSWKHIDLGAGNHLFVRTALYKKIGERLMAVRPPVRYKTWREIVAEAELGEAPTRKTQKRQAKKQ
ncbi:MAG: macro domain-containing protein [Clostridia bacterium]|nr:macro domain-containing protein [Clostridia bacterium]